MNAKQLANVLIKVLGLSICLHAVPSFFSEIILAVFSRTFRGEAALVQFLAFMLGAGAQSVLGVFLIVKTRTVIEFLFKGEEI